MLIFLPARYDLAVVAASILIAAFASFVALDLAKRVRAHERKIAITWWVVGSIAMGTGIWSMHFVGMLAFSLPISLGYTRFLTFASWAAGVAVSALALYLASRRELTVARLWGGALVMGSGICAMHYMGMAALDMAPGIDWDPVWVAASIVIAVGASAAALFLFAWLRGLHGSRGRVLQMLAALVMGLAISGMHYAGMAAARFPADSFCLSAGELAGHDLGVLISVASIGLLSMTLFTSTLDARMRSKTVLLAKSLQVSNAQLKSANEKLQQRAFLDPLTGLPNRLLFEDRLGQALHRIERKGARSGDHDAALAVLFVDLDGFKPVNDSLGHAAGDDVLKEVGARLRHCARDGDTVARIGGDEFLVLMQQVAHVPDSVALAHRIVETLAAPFDIHGRHIEISASVGIVVYPDQVQTDNLVALADAAMYAAKRAGGNTYALYEAQMHEGGNQLNLQMDLRHAIALGQLELHYQPKVDGRDGHLTGCEALLRWHHPTQGSISPVVFIPLAERNGLIGAIGNWVIEEACRQAKAWTERGLCLSVAVNLSTYQLREEDLVERIGRVLFRHQLDPSQLLCEITESAAMDDVRITQRTLEELARIGVFLSIDDFGTGYSSLTYLRQLRAHQLKIDRSFIGDLESCNDAYAIVSAVIRLAHALGLRVVAEGVETRGQHALLSLLSCDEMQGYFFAKPMPAHAFEEWARQRTGMGPEIAGSNPILLKKCA
ncbi:MAG: EAL domain-containing protein [Burkholderiaceae bacterium]